MNLLNVSRPRDSLLSQSPSAILALLRPSIRSQAIKIEGLSSARSDPFDFFTRDKQPQPEEKDSHDANRKPNKDSETPAFIVRAPKKGILVKRNARTSSLLLNEEKTPENPGKGSSCPSFKGLVENEIRSENLDSLPGDQSTLHKTTLLVSPEVPQPVQHKKVSFAPDVQSREGAQRPRIKKLSRKMRNQNVNEVEDINLDQPKKCEEHTSENLKFRLALNGVISPSMRQNASPLVENFKQSLLKINHDPEIKELETNLRQSFEQRTRKISDQEIMNIKLPSIVPLKEKYAVSESLPGSHRSAKSLKEFISPRVSDSTPEKSHRKDNMFNAGLVWKKDDDLSSVMKARLQLIHQYDSPITSTPDLYTQEERMRPKRSLLRFQHESEGLLMAL